MQDAVKLKEMYHLNIKFWFYIKLFKNSYKYQKNWSMAACVVLYNTKRRFKHIEVFSFNIQKQWKVYLMFVFPQ